MLKAKMKSSRILLPFSFLLLVKVLVVANALKKPTTLRLGRDLSTGSLLQKRNRNLQLDRRGDPSWEELDANKFDAPTDSQDSTDTDDSDLRSSSSDESTMTSPSVNIDASSHSTGSSTEDIASDEATTSPTDNAKDSDEPTIQSSSNNTPKRPRASKRVSLAQSTRESRDLWGHYYRNSKSSKGKGKGGSKRYYSSRSRSHKSRGKGRSKRYSGKGKGRSYGKGKGRSYRGGYGGHWNFWTRNYFYYYKNPQPSPRPPSLRPTPRPTTPRRATPRPTPTPPTLAPTPVIDNPKGFDCDDKFPFTLNRNPEKFNNETANEYPKAVTGDGDDQVGYGNDTCFLRMTPDEQVARASSAFVQANLGSKLEFSMSIGYRIYGPAYKPDGDGMAFVMHQDPQGLNAIGDVGGWLGVYGATIGATIRPAIVVEWDTYNNVNDPDNNEKFFHDDGVNNVHVQTISRDGNITELAETPNNSVSIRTDDTGVPGRLWVDYSDSELRVYINSSGDEKPDSPQLATEVDLPSLFDGGNVFVGYTASTTGAADYQDIVSWECKGLSICPQ